MQRRVYVTDDNEISAQGEFCTLLKRCGEGGGGVQRGREKESVTQRGGGGGGAVMERRNTWL